jgi:antitoxin VapB
MMYIAGISMPLHIIDGETDRLVRRLARARGIGLTEAVKLAVAAELRRAPLQERLKPLIDEVASLPPTGRKADKAYFDSLDGPDDVR